MKITVTQENLAKALNTVGRVASSRTSLPILNNILIRTENNRLMLAATNLEVAITEYIGAKVEADGAITVPAKLMSEFVTNLPKTNITLEVEDSKLHIIAGNYRSTINATLADEFPALPEIEPTNEITIPSDVLKKAVSQTTLVASNDTTRPILTGVYFHTFENTIYMTATDGYRLAERRVIPFTGDIQAIIPGNTLNDVVRVLSDDVADVAIKINDEQISFEVGDIVVTSRLIDGNFIDYRQLIPKSTETSATLEKSEFVRITKISELFARESAGSVTLKADPVSAMLTIKSIASQLGENTSEAEANITGDGEITLNSKYLLDALGCFDGEKVTFQFSGKLAPSLLTSENSGDYKHIIMPVKS